MSNYALIKDGIVAQVIIADANFIETLPNSAEWIQVSEDETEDGKFANRGYLYNSETGLFSVPEITNLD
jgi:hypothetical protein